jgi:hypothetical protein
LPWHVPFAVPTDTVLATWRDAAGPEPALLLQDMVLAASDAEHREHNYRAVAVGDLQLCSIDGSVTRMPDTPAANRAGFGSATSDEGAPYPQLRDLPVTDASTRGMLAVVTGPSSGDKVEAEQALLDRALSEYAWVFTKRRLFVMDRNFPGVTRIRRLVQVTHALIRLKSDITVTKTGDFLPDGSYLAGIGGTDRRRGPPAGRAWNGIRGRCWPSAIADRRNALPQKVNYITGLAFDGIGDTVFLELAKNVCSQSRSAIRR